MISEDNSTSPTTTMVTLSSEITSVTLSEINESSLVNELMYSTPAENTTDTSGTTNSTSLLPDRLSVPYTIAEATVSLLAIFGNALVVYIFCKNRSLRRYRNYYIVALAIADFLVGLLGIPFAVLASVGLPRNLYGCLFTVSILMVLCTVSILCLVAVSIDRYWATTNPFAYYRNMTTTTAVSIILFCWVAGAIIGFLPLFGWYNKKGWEAEPSEYCFFTDVMDYSYLVFLYFATIVFPALLMIGFYGYIYHVVLIKIRQKGTLAPQHLRRFSEQSRMGSLSCENRSATQVLRIMVSEKRREAKAAKKLGIIVLFFMLCWMPLYTINCIQAFFPKFNVPLGLINFCIILSHANSALNPFLYAYHLKEFRMAMKHALLSLLVKLCCGLVNIHVEKEHPLGAMSRSLTMPSIGHVTTVPNPTGKVSIKFQKISRPDDSRSANLSPTNIHSTMMMSAVMMRAASRDNLLCTTGATGKSLTSLSLASDTSNQVLEIPLQVTTTSFIKSTSASSSPRNAQPGSNGCHKSCSSRNGHLSYNHCALSMSKKPAETSTVPGLHPHLNTSPSSPEAGNNFTISSSGGKEGDRSWEDNDTVIDDEDVEVVHTHALNDLSNNCSSQVVSDLSSCRTPEVDEVEDLGHEDNNHSTTHPLESQPHSNSSDDICSDSSRPTNIVLTAEVTGNVCQKKSELSQNCIGSPTSNGQGTNCISIE